MSDADRQLAKLANGAALGVVVESDAMPQVRLDPDLNVTAKRLGELVARLDLFEMNGVMVIFNHRGEREEMTPVLFRTWIAEHVLIYRRRTKDTDGPNAPITETMTRDDAGTILVNLNFRRGVRPLKGVNHVRCPVLRPDGTLELLPWGYDAQAEIYTIEGGLEYSLEVDVDAAKGRLRREFGSFPITDERSYAVQVAAMLALYIRHLPAGTGLRPGVLWYANKPGSGKSVLAKACLYPVLGSAAAAKMKQKEELDKELEAFSRARVPYIFLDNIYGGIQSASIDQLLTSEESTGRGMGGHGVFVAQNSALLLATGNQIDLNEDALRRFLLVDLFEKGNPEERVVAVPLNDSRMRSAEWRISMLEALWAIVKHWHEQGMPVGTVSLASFEAYAALLGGIVEAAGYEPPFTKAHLPDAKSPGAQEFEELMVLVLAEMGEQKEKDFTLQDLARLARSGQLYLQDVGTQDDGRKLTIKQDGLKAEERSYAQDRGYLTDSQNSAFGKKMKKEMGTNKKAGGHTLEFGKRKQARRATYTVTVVE